MALSVRIQGTTQLRATLQRLGSQAERALGVALYQEAERVMAKSKSEVPVGVSGHLRSGGFVRLPRRDATSVIVELGYGGDAADYALYVHEGTGPAVGRPPFFPPPAAFKDWARKFLGDEALAFVVARAVGRRGTAPSKFLERPLMEAAGGMATRLARTIRARFKG